MATTTKSKSTGESKAHSDQKTALSWNNGNTGVLVGAAVAGAAVGLAANAGRKLFMQFGNVTRSEEHTSELQSLMRISYAVFCWTKKTTNKQKTQREEPAS